MSTARATSRVAILIALIACVASCTAKSSERAAAVGDRCHSFTDCHPLGCADGVCVTVPRDDGASCGSGARCREGLTCYPKDYYGKNRKCVANPEQHEKELQKVAEKEALEQSGVEVPETDSAEASSPPAVGPGLPVRVVKTSAELVGARAKTFAACKADERLTGGGCSTARVENGPEAVGDHDTVGGRWACYGSHGKKVTAFAMCQKLP